MVCNGMKLKVMTGSVYFVSLNIISGNIQSALKSPLYVTFVKSWSIYISMTFSIRRAFTARKIYVIKMIFIYISYNYHS